MHYDPNDFGKAELAMAAEMSTMAAVRVQVNNGEYAAALSALLEKDGPLDKEEVGNTATAYIEKNTAIMEELWQKLQLLRQPSASSAN